MHSLLGMILLHLAMSFLHQRRFCMRYKAIAAVVKSTLPGVEYMQVLATTTELHSFVTSSKHTVELLAIQNFQYLHI